MTGTSVLVRAVSLGLPHADTYVRRDPMSSSSEAKDLLLWFPVPGVVRGFRYSVLVFGFSV